MGGLNIQLGSKHILINPRNNSQERKQDIALKETPLTSIYGYGKVITMYRSKNFHIMWSLSYTCISVYKFTRFFGEGVVDRVWLV